MGVNVRVCQEYSRKDSNYKWKIIPINKLKPADAKKPGSGDIAFLFVS